MAASKRFVSQDEKDICMDREFDGAAQGSSALSKQTNAGLEAIATQIDALMMTLVNIQTQWAKGLIDKTKAFVVDAERHPVAAPRSGLRGADVVADGLSGADADARSTDSAATLPMSGASSVADASDVCDGDLEK